MSSSSPLSLSILEMSVNGVPKSVHNSTGATVGKTFGILSMKAKSAQNILTVNVITRLDLQIFLSIVTSTLVFLRF
jgi:hypothetical protein